MGGEGESGPVSKRMVLAQLTGTPSRTRPTARRVCSGVIRLRVPSWSSVPQRPQLLSVVKYCRTSASVGMPCCIVPPPCSSKLVRGARRCDANAGLYEILELDHMVVDDLPM